LSSFFFLRRNAPFPQLGTLLLNPRSYYHSRPIRKPQEPDAMAGSLPPLDHGHLTLMKFSITGRLGAHHKQKLSKFSAEIERLRHVVPDRPAKPAPSRERAAPKLRPLEAPPRMVVKTQNPFPESPKSKSSLSPIHTEAKLKLLMRHDLKAMPTVKPLIRKVCSQVKFVVWALD